MTLAEAPARRQALLEKLAHSPSGLDWAREYTDWCDEVVRALAAEATEEQPCFTVIATGGYGRRELSPHSDVDLTVVPTDENDPAVDAAVRRFFRALYATFSTDYGVEVGYAYRLVGDAAGLDAKTRTGLLDLRHLAGPRDLTRALERALRDTFSAGEFVLGKIREREAMFAKHHDTPLVAEPHLKEGAGGLRCAHCANWIRVSLGERPVEPDAASDVVLRTRNLLHLVTHRHQDLLVRTRQEEIAALLGRDPREMMSEIAEAGLALHRDYAGTVERLQESRFPLADGVLALRGEIRLDGEVDAGDAAVGVAIATRLGLKVADVRLAVSGFQKGPAALFALSSGERTVRNLDRAGLLGDVLPELARCRTLMPDDPVHEYTVFEHTLRVVREVDRIEPGTFLGDLKDAVTDREVLYLACLLHDVGKQTGEDHSVAGERIAREVGRRWGLEAGLVDTVAWLVREHLTMSRFLRIRDLDHPETIREFARLVGDVNRLNLLAVLTYADVRAVADGAWTPAQTAFHRQLYVATADALHADLEEAPDPSLYRRRLLRQLAGQSTEDTDTQRFVESLPAAYLTSTPPEIVRLHLHQAEEARRGQPSVDLTPRGDLGATEVTLVAPDRAGLLARVLGTFYAFDVSLLAVRACTAALEPPVAIDVFTVSFGGRSVPPATAAELHRVLLSVWDDDAEAERVLRAKGKDPTREQRIFTYTYTEGSPGVLEIRAPRGRGMPYRFAQLFARQGWNVTAARVGQWAGNAAAAFYLLGPEGTPISKARIAAVLDHLDSPVGSA